MSFPRYPAYKPSGVEWLGEVPEHWVPNKICAISSLKGRLGWQGLKADEYREQGPYVVSSAHFQNHRIQWEECPRVSQERHDTDENIQLAENDVLLMKDGAAMGKLAFVDQLPGPACLNSHLLLFRPREVGGAPAYYPKFAFYFMQTGYFQEHIRINGTGATFLGISQDAIGRYQICLPSLPEQVHIATFLDRETAKIDALIAEQQRLIELLQEKRQAVISHAVTKGLNPDAPMKDSGVEWLGEVPEHWVVTPLRLAARIESGHTPSRAVGSYWIEEECIFPWFTLADVWQIRSGKTDYVFETKERVSQAGLDNSAARLLPKRTVILSRTASVGYSAILGEEMATTQDFVNWICGQKLVPEFLLLVFRGMKGEFERLKYGSTHNTIYMPDVYSFRASLPPIEEQAEIVTEVRKKVSNQDQANDSLQNALSLLQERRSALISAAVTGQIDVRGLVEAEAGEP